MTTGIELRKLLVGAEETSILIQAEEQAESRFSFLTPMELANLPPLAWQVEDHIPLGGFIVLFGQSGGGKTFIGLDIALTVSTGLQWGGRGVERGHVIYVSAEGRSGLNQRIKAWQAYHEHLASLDNIHVVTESVNLLNPDTVRDFVLGVKAHAARPALIVLDTLARCLEGGDENSAQDMGKAIAAIDQIRRETGAAIMVVHHTTKASPDTERGSGALRGAADTMMLVRNEDGCITLSCDKQKDAAPFAATHWKLETIETVSSCVPVKLDSDLSTNRRPGEQWAYPDFMDRSLKQGPFGLNKFRFQTVQG